MSYITKGNPAYNKAKPKQFGNVHERMKYLLTVMHDHLLNDANLPSDFAWAIFDLETAVKMNPCGKKPR